MLNVNPVRLFLALYIAGGMGLFAVLFVPVEVGAVFVDTGSTPLFMGMWMLCYAISLMMFVLSRPKLDYGNLMVCIIPVFYIIGSTWSLDSKKSLIYASTLLLNAFFCMVLQKVVPPKKFPKFILSVILFLCIVGGIAALAGYQNARYIDIHERITIIGTSPIRGFFNHKITAGLYASFGFVIALCTLRGLKRLGVLSVITIFVILTGSSTGLSLLVIGLFLYMLVSLLLSKRVSPTLFLSFLIIFIGIALGLFLLIGTDILILMNRDPTLTGRVPLWGLGFSVSLERFLTGWGYFAYNGSDHAIMKAYHFYAQFDNYVIPHFHNSYVQFLVEAGWVFGGLFIGLYFYTLKGWYSMSLYNSEVRQYKAILLVIMLMMIAGIFVHTLGRYNDGSMIMFMYALSFASYFSNQKKITT